MRIWRFAVIIYALGAACLAPARLSAPRLSPDLLDRIEREARLPTGAAPIASYARFYALTTLRRISAQSPDDRPMVMAIYMRGEGLPGRLVATVETLPKFSGHGCDTIMLYYDIDGERMSGVNCAGG